MPNLAGRTEAAARQALQAAGFTGTITVESSRAEPDDVPGTVVETNPQPGAKVPAGQAVTLFIAQADPGG